MTKSNISIAEMAAAGAYHPATGRTYLSQAVYDNDLALVDALLKAGADVNAKDRVLPEQKEAQEKEQDASGLAFAQQQAWRTQWTKGGDTALHTALRGYNDDPVLPELGFVEAGTEKILGWFVTNADIGHYARNGYNPAIVQRLLEAGPDVNQTNDAGYPPLFYAVRFRHFEEAKTLLARDANPNHIVDGQISILKELPRAKDSRILLDLLRAGLNLDTPYANGNSFRKNARTHRKEMFGRFEEEAKYALLTVQSISESDTARRLALLLDGEGNPTDALLAIAHFEQLGDLLKPKHWRASPEAATTIWEAAAPIVRTNYYEHEKALLNYALCLDPVLTDGRERIFVQPDGSASLDLILLTASNYSTTYPRLAELFSPEYWGPSEKAVGALKRLWAATEPLLQDKPELAAKAGLNYALGLTVGEPGQRMEALLDASGQPTPLLKWIAKKEVPKLFSPEYWGPSEQAVRALKRLWAATEPLLQDKPELAAKAGLNYALGLTVGEPGQRMEALLDTSGQPTQLLKWIAQEGLLPNLLAEEHWRDAARARLKVWDALPEGVRTKHAAEIDMSTVRRDVNDMTEGSRAGWQDRTRRRGSGNSSREQG